MFEIVFLIWYFVIILPFLIFLEGSSMFAGFLKKKNIYSYWDVWHSFLVIFILLTILLWIKGHH